jgi:hypothetical protein
MRIVVWIGVFIGVLWSRSSLASADETESVEGPTSPRSKLDERVAVAPPAPRWQREGYELTWYGGQTILASLAFGIVPGALIVDAGEDYRALGLSVLVVGVMAAGPLVDWKNGDLGNMRRSIIINAIWGSVALLAANTKDRRDPDREGHTITFPAYVLAPLLSGWAIGLNSLMAWKWVPTEGETPDPSLSLMVVPQNGGLKFGFAGAF